MCSLALKTSQQLTGVDATYGQDRHWRHHSRRLSERCVGGRAGEGGVIRERARGSLNWECVREGQGVWGGEGIWGEGEEAQQPDVVLASRASDILEWTCWDGWRHHRGPGRSCCRCITWLVDDAVHKAMPVAPCRHSLALLPLHALMSFHKAWGQHAKCIAPPLSHHQLQCMGEP